MARKSTSWCKSNDMDYKALMQVIKVRNSLEKKLNQLGFKTSTSGRNSYSVQLSILRAFFSNVAKRQHDGSYKMLRGETVIMY